MNATDTAAKLADITARLKSARSARASKLAPSGTLPAVGDTVIDLRSRRGRCESCANGSVRVDFDGEPLTVSVAYFSGRAAWRVERA